MINKEKLMEFYIKIKKIFKLCDENEEEIFYICGNEKLPAPLKEEEEQELLERLMNKDLEAKNILIERNLRLVVYISKKFESTGINIEDLISIGTIGLIKAINSYKLDKNIKLADRKSVV